MVDETIQLYTIYVFFIYIYDTFSLPRIIIKLTSFELYFFAIMFKEAYPLHAYDYNLMIETSA